jgi:hypothetical protein
MKDTEKLFANGIYMLANGSLLSRFFAAYLIFGATVAYANEALVKDVKAFRENLRAAVAKNDSAAVAAMLSPNFVYVHGSGKTDNKEARVASLLTGRAMETQPEDALNIEVVSERTAVARGKTNMPASVTAPAFILNWNAIYMFEQGRWQAAYVQSWR